jgi:hypothetical protein
LRGDFPEAHFFQELAQSRQFEIRTGDMVMHRDDDARFQQADYFSCLSGI